MLEECDETSSVWEALKKVVLYLSILADNGYLNLRKMFAALNLRTMSITLGSAIDYNQSFYELHSNSTPVR